MLRQAQHEDSCQVLILSPSKDADGTVVKSPSELRCRGPSAITRALFVSLNLGPRL